MNNHKKTDITLAPRGVIHAPPDDRESSILYSITSGFRINLIIPTGIAILTVST